MDQPKGNKPPRCSLRLRRDLHVSLERDDAGAYYTIEDPAEGGFYRIGLREWDLANRLDGKASLADVVASIQAEPGRQEFTLAEAEAILRPLVMAGLVLRETPDGRPMPLPQHGSPGAKALAKANPFFLRAPLFCPDRRLAAALPWCGWIISRSFFVVWAIVVAIGGYSVFAQWQRFADAASTYLAPQSWIYLMLGWCLLKIVHEFFHGIVCKKYGGTVGSAGIALILFSPVAFMDVTSAWRFRSKWQRIFTSAAGMYVELLIAGTAAIAWANTGTGTLNQICHSLVTMASVTTILFNANPLMRFDGYFILSDLLGIPNLYPSGQQYVRNLLRRLFLGLPPVAVAKASRSHRRIIAAYGLAAACWRILVSVSMILIASTLFHGAGLVVALLGVALWFGLPAWKFVRGMVNSRSPQQPNRLRFAMTGSAAAGGLASLLCCPWPGGVSAPGVVIHSPEQIVRAGADAFVEQVHVSPGEMVSQGQLLATLRNDELTASLTQAQLAVLQSSIRSRMLLNGADGHAAYQAELEQLEALKKREAHLRARVDQLEVRATIDGAVLGRDLHSLVGQFVTTGAALMRVASHERKVLHVSIPEMYHDEFSQQVGATPRVRVRGHSRKVTAGKLARVEPQATVQLRHPALASIHGGPLPVRAVQADGSGAKGGLEFTSPRFRGVVELPAEQAIELRAGQLATVRLGRANETIGRRVRRAVGNWINEKLGRGVVATATR